MTILNAEQYVTPPSNRPSGLTSAQVNALLRTHLRAEALVKFAESSYSAVPFNKSTGLSATNWTMTVKMEQESPFWAVRLLGINRAANAINNITALIGVTETDSISTSNNLSVPVISGTAYAQLQAVNTINGFRAVTWGGAGSVSIPAATSAQQFVLSDRLGLASIDRAAGQSSTRPLLLWRSYLPGATTNWAYIPITPMASMQVPTASMRNRIIQVSSATSDAVTTPATAMSLVTTIMEVYPVVSFKTPVLSVWGIGDSITSGSSIVADGLSTWGYRACLDVSTPTTPVVWANLGMVSQTSATYWANAKAMLVAGVPPPSVLVLGPVSVNDTSWTQAKIQTARELAMDVVLTAATYRIPYIIWWPLLPHNILDTGNDPLRQQLNIEMATVAASFGIHWMSGLSVLSTGTNPARWKPEYNYTNDGIHPNELAMETVLAKSLSTILRELIPAPTATRDDGA